MLTHTAPKSLVHKMGYSGDPHEMELSGFLDWIWYEVTFRHLYYGHWHMDQEIDEKATAVYYDVHKLDNEEK